MAYCSTQRKASGGRPAGQLFTLALLGLIVLPTVHAETAAPAPQVPQVELDRLKRPEGAPPAKDLFNARSWEPRVREKKAPEVAPPPAPTAPPLPFAYVGRWLERGETIVVLSKAGQTYIVHAGESLDGTYVLETIEDDKLTIRYLPLGIAQVLSFSNGAPTGAPRTPQIGDNRPRPRAPTRDADDEED